MNNSISKFAVILLLVCCTTGTVFAADSTAPYITEAVAQEIALEHAGFVFADVTALRIWQERDDRRMVYEVVFSNGDTYYEYKLDAVSGDIEEYQYDVREIRGRSSVVASDSQSIGRNEALDIVIGQVPGSSRRDVRMERDHDDGRRVYEGEFFYDGYEYDFELDATTGRILSWEADFIGNRWR